MQNVFILLLIVLLSGCAFKTQKELVLDECTRSAGVLPQPEHHFPGVSTNNLNPEVAIPACRERVAADVNDTHATFLLARSLTKNAQYDEAFGLMVEQICREGNDAECTLLAGYYFYGFTPVRSDRKKAVRMYEKACTNGYPVACLNLGKSYIAGTGVAQDPQRGAKLVFNECQNGLGIACHHFVNSMYFGKIPFNQEQFDFAAKKACESGLDCTDFWKKYDKEKDEDLLQENFDVTTTSCDNGLAKACERLGTYHLNGIGVSKDLAKSQTLYEKACANGDVRFGCWYAGRMMLNNGEDEDKAHKLINRACYEGENTFACYDLAMIYLNKPNLTDAELKTAKEYLTYACRRGNVRSCAVLESINANPR
ncbi:MAG: hypothetical protein BV458_11650 [Thermoplasmata archaeon M9B2D]|nr:MAG: hypothetical protein BV458_11650 [Thermoplasmata archaeon M9B2D]